MKHLLLTTIAAVVLVGCDESQQLAPAPKAKPKPPTAKASRITIHDAARDGNIEAVKQHLAAGTDVNTKNDRNGWTPLHWAALYGRTEVAELLIAKGAGVNAMNENGETRLDYAVTEHKTANLLRKHGGKTAQEFKAEGK